jgi:4'-phosphopantetheinyl transferase EntD
MDTEDLTRFLNDQLPNGCVGAVRPICAGDEVLLRPAEASGLEGAVVGVRCASGAGRNLARSLCSRIGVEIAEIPRSPHRFPVWPSDVTGSIAHDADFAAAVVAPTRRIKGLGIDIEPAEPLPQIVHEGLGRADELASFEDLPFGHKALFSIKEAVFKAVYPSDLIFLDFRDIVVVRDLNTATTANNRVLEWRVVTSPRVLAIAWW